MPTHKVFVTLQVTNEVEAREAVDDLTDKYRRKSSLPR